MVQPNKDIISGQIASLGLERGDVVFVSSDLMRVGYFSKTPETTLRDWVDILCDAVGSEGTVVVPTYSPSTLRPPLGRLSGFVYTKDSLSESGSMANAFIDHAPMGVRGAHPTCSCIAVGPLAQKIAGEHGVGDDPYFPYGRIIERGGKNLMLGTVDLKNCPMPFHFAQHTLGHTRRHPLSGLLETRYLDDAGREQRYIVREIGGCTRGVHKAWGYILNKNGVRFGTVGRSLSALVDAKIAYDVLLQVLQKQPRLIRCDEPNCISCHGRFVYNGFGVVPYYLRKPVAVMRSRMQRRRK